MAGFVRFVGLQALETGTFKSMRGVGTCFSLSCHLENEDILEVGKLAAVRSMSFTAIAWVQTLATELLNDFGQCVCLSFFKEPHDTPSGRPHGNIHV